MVIKYNFYDIVKSNNPELKEINSCLSFKSGHFNLVQTGHYYFATTMEIEMDGLFERFGL